MGHYAKAIVGAVLAGLGGVEIALMDDVVTTSEWVRVAITTVAALGLVWGVQNAPAKEPTPVDRAEVAP
jgi:hypothetical protein